MNNKSILFLTKDAFFRGYLPVYGNKIWNTPNIDELASKGTVFMNHHTGAPSTIMSNMCMFTKLNSYESGLSDYTFSKMIHHGETLWTRAEAEGFECHIIWDEAWDSVFRARDRYYCYGDNTVFHPLENIRQGVGAHYKHEGFLKGDSNKYAETQIKIEKEIKKIFSEARKPVFLWVHIPHVINGFTSYGSDIEAFDGLVGIGREYFDDSNIFISADHGNMNGAKGKLCYGHDVYEPSALIPLITPSIEGEKTISYLTTNIDITSVIFDRTAVQRDFIFCDSAFYAQANRKIAIYHRNFKYIYNKFNDSEELYDLEYDPNENCNLIKDFVYDVDRHTTVPLRELYYHPNWEMVEKMRKTFRDKKGEIWRNGSPKQESYNRFMYAFVNKHPRIHKILKSILR